MKDTFSLEEIEETETYVKSLSDNWNEVDNVVNFYNKEDYSDWESMLSFTMYQTLTVCFEKMEESKIKYHVL